MEPQFTSSSDPVAVSGRSAEPESTARRRQRLFFAVGAWMFLLVGVGHLLLAELAPRLSGPSPAEAAVLEEMRQLRPMPGTQHSLADFYSGSSIGMASCCSRSAC